MPQKTTLMSGLDKFIPGRRASGIVREEGRADDEDKADEEDIPASSESSRAGGNEKQTNLRPQLINQDLSTTSRTPENATSASNIHYKHWNVFFKDVFSVSLEIVDRETNRVISQ